MTVLVLVALAAGSAFSQSASAPKPADSNESARAAIRHLLAKQVDAWNRHDLEGFMAGYWNSPDLTFFSGTTVTRGWQPTLQRYRNKYQAQGKDMGKLDFYDLEVDLLDPNAAVVQGHWKLTMSNASQSNGGLFTLVLRKFADGWKIVHDHTS